MLARLALLALVGVLSAATLLGPLGTQPAQADAKWGPIIFSSDLDNGEPAGIIGGDFPGDNHGVFVTFSYQDLPANTAVTRVVRFNNSDFNFDKPPFAPLNCCGAGSGKVNFQVVKADGDEGKLPGGGYQVYIFAGGDQPVLTGGFEIHGTAGSDNPENDNNDNGGGNDNGDNG